MSRTHHPLSSPPSSALAPVGLSRRAALASLIVLPLAACGSGDADSPAPDTGASGSDDGGADPTASETISVTDPWVKAAEDGMTAAFGTVTNGTSGDLVLTAASTPASGEVQLHETAPDGSGGMSMQEKAGGFELPIGEELVLEPGGNHLMLMDLTEPLRPGDQVELTLVFSEGTEHQFSATVKDYAGAQEHYSPEGDDGSGTSDAGGEHAGHEDGE
ncbi:copper chaperone PCu(A)C [Brachybacterium sacelli]|uniref:Copper(I)-binding protein n=1 Tax=Brachybacterium sacelli TaxID=173364 RepID=A0ABS4WWQ1_9MICO|nr:copper chaperone PCu(A)C [Brachybacterium sacelli]MBP2380629.1 copper(I)-binding protein [Brachybacterium sacelli]